MMNKFSVLGLILLVSVFGFSGCDNGSSSSVSVGPEIVPQGDKIDNVTPSQDDSKSACGFNKADNVWKFTYSTWNITDSYTWLDESTVKYETYMNAYHMDDEDSTYTNVNRDAFFEQVMQDCLVLTSGDAE